MNTNSVDIQVKSQYAWMSSSHAVKMFAVEQDGKILEWFRTEEEADRFALTALEPFQDHGE
jgi:hypothetical protein|tara:strand:- start:594 stop:776 length:183 start_codon:yes stop_codon:yes gene_type:complete